MNTSIQEKITKSYLDILTKQLYDEFGFNQNEVRYFLLENGDFAEINSSLGGWCKVKIGIKEFLNAEIGDVLYETYFKNTVFRQLPTT